MLSFLIAAPAVALGAVSVTVPPGWTRDHDIPAAARMRADAWAGATGYTLRQRASPVGADAFAETLAVLEIGQPMSATTGDPEATVKILLHALAPLPRAPRHLERFAVRGLPSGGAVLQGEWTSDGMRFLAGLAPSSATQTLVLMAVKAEEVSLYRPVFASVMEDLEGVAAPVVPFPVKAWRLGMLVGWLVLAVAVYWGVRLWAEPSPDPRATTRRTSIALSVVAVLVGLLSFLFFGLFFENALHAAQMDAFALATQTALAGLLTAALLAVAGRLLDRDGRVRSAPTASAFAGSDRPRTPPLYDPTGVELVRMDSDATASTSSPRPLETPRSIAVPEVGEANIDRHSLAELAKDPTPASLVEATSESGGIHLDENATTKPHTTVKAPTPKEQPSRGHQRSPHPRASAPLGAAGPKLPRPKPAGGPATPPASVTPRPASPHRPAASHPPAAREGSIDVKKRNREADE